MPYVIPDAGRDVPLPSNPDYHVKIRTRPVQGQQMVAMEVAYAIGEASGGAKGRAIAEGERDLLVALALEWNLDDDNGPVELTAENIERCLLPEDMTALVDACNQVFREARERAEVSGPLATRSPRQRKATA